MAFNDQTFELSKFNNRYTTGNIKLINLLDRLVIDSSNLIN